MVFVFIMGGLISLCIAALVYTVLQAFFSTGSRTIPGKVVEIVVFEQTSKDALGRVNDITEAQEPIVEFFHAGKTYRFQANVHASASSLTVGSNVSVVINEQKYPGAAKLAEEASSYRLITMICTMLGSVFLLVGIVLFDLKAFLSSLSSPFSWVWLVGTAVSLFLVGRKIQLKMRSFPLFPENITEVKQKY